MTEFKIPVIDTSTMHSPTTLCCPRCDFDGGMHHDSVRIFRRGEDADTTESINVTRHGIFIKQLPSRLCDNPSSRRGAVVIGFSCENCGGEFGFELCIVQHKGTTQLEWRGDVE
jgi:hypothetical protein